VGTRHVPVELTALLAERTARARAAWPSIALDDERFERAVAARLGDAPTADALAALHADDLWLACACADGDPAALAAFEVHCGPTIERAIATAGIPPAERADLVQVVRQRLLVAPADGPPRIASYSARGSLVAWVRVVATREAMRALPRTARELAAEDDELARVVAPSDDPELGYLKRLYREELKQALAAAVDALDDRDRLLLRQHLLDRVGIDQLAAQHAVHRATVARWIEAAREAVVAATQRELLRRLRLTRSELASVLHLIRSDLDVSLPRVLSPGSG
jgi:RNA polymerase sigma-70 factor, ECF subfamily